MFPSEKICFFLNVFSWCSKNTLENNGQKPFFPSPTVSWTGTSHSKPNVTPRPLSHEKDPALLPLYWLVHTDPYNGLLKSLYNRVVYSPIISIIYPKQPGSRFSLLFSFPTSSPKIPVAPGVFSRKEHFPECPPRLPRKKALLLMVHKSHSQPPGMYKTL